MAETVLFLHGTYRVHGLNTLVSRVPGGPRARGPTHKEQIPPFPSFLSVTPAYTHTHTDPNIQTAWLRHPPSWEEVLTVGTDENVVSLKLSTPALTSSHPLPFPSLSPKSKVPCSLRKGGGSGGRKEVHKNRPEQALMKGGQRVRQARRAGLPNAERPEN